MDNKELVKIINDSFKGLDCTKAQKGAWILHMPEIAVVFRVRISSWSKLFYIDLGVIFKGLFQNQDLKKISIEDVHIGHGLYNLLLEFGDSKEYLEKLFSFGSSETETLDNIATIFRLLNSKAMPYFENLNNYNFLAENFQNKIAFKPLFVYFESPEYYVDFFKKQIK